MKTYFIVSEKSLKNLTQKVNQMIVSGQRCLGAPFEDSKQNFNQAMLSKVLIKKKEDHHLNRVNLDKTCEYFVMIKFKLLKETEDQFFNEVENYLRKFPYEGLKFCEIFDLVTKIPMSYL